MPIIKSAIKRVSVNERQKNENRAPKSELANALKKFRALLAAGKVEEAEKLLPDMYSLVDVSARKGIITKENASRKKARLANALEKAKKAE
ncbi:MAG: 30S ribosomal protein S20 [Clostridia bacterium]|nr:30S ribosomal protein S20 [Clostridia bacterium]